MAILKYQDETHQDCEREFTAMLSIGSNRQSIQAVLQGEIVLLPASLGVAPHHATIVFSKTRYHDGLFILVGAGDRPVKVNGQPVVSIKVLHHGDKIQLDRANLIFYELSISRLSQNERAKKCSLCTEDLAVGDEVIFCPHCTLPYCRTCGLTS